MPLTLPITTKNVREWFPAPRVENPFAAEPWWQLQTLGLLNAIQLMRLLPEGDFLQQSLIEMRRAVDTALLAVTVPDDDEVRSRMAQSLAPWCPSSDMVVDTMLTMAGIVGCDDPRPRVIDLGSGDGRIVFEAVERGAWGVGIEIDGRFVAECRERKRRRASFFQADVLTVDFAAFQPDVVMCYLLSSSMAVLRDKFKQLKPGVRIVSHAFPIPDWEPKDVRMVGETPIYLYII